MPVQPDVPTSVALAQLLEEAPRDQVTLGWLIDHLQKRAFGLLLLILSVLGLAPGVATIIGLVIAIPAVELMLGRETPTLPRFLTARSMPTPKFAAAVNRLIPFFRTMETIVRPRFQLPFRTTNGLVGLLVFLLAITLFAPFPFNIIPTLVIMLIAFSYLQEDGVFLCISFAAAVLSLSFTDAIVLAALRATGFLHDLWLRA
jgi:hypothetical protein